MEQISLEKIGLTKNESIVYLTLLRLGISKTGRILKESKLNSGKIYEILESLKQKGLVSEIKRDNVRIFSAAPPTQILYFLEQKKEEINQNEKKLLNMIPSLEQLRKFTLPEKKIIQYTGFKGIITGAEESLKQLKENDEILSLGISDVNAWSQKYWMKWERMRESKNINCKYILSQKGIIYRDLQKIKNVQIRIIDVNTPVGIDIYGNKIVLILHYQEPISVTIIYDENTATTLKSYFEILWAIGSK